MTSRTFLHSPSFAASMNARILALCLLVLAIGLVSSHAADAIPRVLPPEGIEIPADVRSRLEGRLADTKKRVNEWREERRENWKPSLKSDVEVFTKAVELALLHGEFYVERDFAKADWALDEANKRLDSLVRGESPWANSTGLVVRGYRSKIDGSVQPYGLVIPDGYDFRKPLPIYVWLHGRGDKNTDLHFLYERATRAGQITPANAIVVHPFGRHCVGWKHAGEIDVLEVIEDLRPRYRLDHDRIVLIGFSMGGAGAWHIGAHYSHRWIAVSPGAGFVDTARYQKLTPDRYGESYVQTLWGLYDVPDYVRNLFNTRVIAYSGELDKQREAAVLMEEAFKGEGRTLEHLIGPGVEHKYEPATLKELMARLDAIVANPPPRSPDEAHLQTRTLRYNRAGWLIAEGLDEHWKDSRIDGKRIGPRIELTTKNVNFVALMTPPDWSDFEYVIDGQVVGKRPQRPHEVKTAGRGTPPRAFVMSRGLLKENDRWRWLGLDGEHFGVGRKLPNQQGPIDDAFMDSFIVVTPTGKSRNPAFQAWCDGELQHFRDRWRALMRGELREVKDTELDLRIHSVRSVILWGDADSNSVIKQVQGLLPVKFSGQQWSLGSKTYDGNRYVPVCICPTIEKSFTAPSYLVLNSGLTFREGHDRTNSQQNPKLPDWAIIDITQPPDAQAPGRIHDADFFDEAWQLKRQPKAP
jgi:pimeloyl-ACP methyl ester carboxylesterase